MDYSKVFVCLMGMGTVFFGLICLIFLTYLMGLLLHRTGTKPAADTGRNIPAVSAEPDDRGALVAAVAAALAEELGTDVSGIRILSMKKL